MEDTIKFYEKERKDLVKELDSIKYKGFKFSEEEIKANELFQSKIVPTFQFKEDFYFSLAMKYKCDIENHPFFKDISAMPKGALLHMHMIDGIDVEWLTNESLKEENKKYIYLHDFSSTLKTNYPLRLIYTLSPEKGDIPLEQLIQDWLKENEGKTSFDFFHSKLSILPNEIEKVQSNSEAWSVFMPKYFFAYKLVYNKKFYRQHIKNVFEQCIKDKLYRLNRD